MYRPEESNHDGETPVEQPPNLVIETWHQDFLVYGTVHSPCAHGSNHHHGRV